jgi:hypothetical protein
MISAHCSIGFWPTLLPIVAIDEARRLQTI